MKKLLFSLLLGAVSGTAADSAFLPVADPMPVYDGRMPQPPVPPPAGTRAVTYDVYGNFWALAPEGHRLRVLVLPAQQPDRWVPDTVGGIVDDNWKFLAADENGLLWLASARQVFCLDPLRRGRAWHNLSADTAFPRGAIVAMSVAPSGAMLVALESGQLVEMDCVEKSQGRGAWLENSFKFENAPAAIRELKTDADGRIWVVAGGRVYRKAAAADAWQRHWELIARMPGSNHDLSGDVLDGRFYVAGGVTAGWGYPPQHTLFEDLLEFDPARAQWRRAAKLGMPRGFNGTSVLGGKVWVIGGDVELTGGRRLAVRTVQICDPRTGEVTMGPDLPMALPMPLAIHIHGRIYVAGSPKDHYDEPGKLFSIGEGESAWKTEPDGPVGMSALAGAAQDGKFYVVAPSRSLAIFDTANQSWTEVAEPHPPRSCEVAAYKDEIWLMGGAGVRDNRATMIFNPRTGKWRDGPDLPRPLNWGAATVVNGRLMVTGGAGGRCYNHRSFLLREE